MSIYKSCSIEKVLAQIYRDFKPSNSGWIDDAAEWIADAISIMKVSQSFIETYKDVQIIDYRGKLPCDIEVLLGIEYENKRLPKSGGINHKQASCSCLDNLVCSVDESYSLNPNYIQTSFKTGCIKVYYNGLETDCNGLPTIIDDAVYREAITWYVLMKMVGRGFKHQVFTYADCDAKWKETYPRAQNRFRMADIDSYEVFKKSYLGLVKSTNLTNEFFNTVVKSESSPNSATFKAGDRVESFPMLGVNQNLID